MIKWQHSNPFLLMEITRRIEKKEYGKTMALKDIMGEEKKISPSSQQMASLQSLEVCRHLSKAT